ncbi:MAG TPA: dihydrolipoyl dehydrogenase [Planctomycetes bacterium]|nr:dihydrolipoyl dehydrogenase [Planctomycetota bacterium]HIN81037.1 dihydrolipoyl dehydrogenase [Planctomycetota bacterium]
MVEKIGKFDVAIIGGGPGGYVAAIRASQLGLKTVLIEKDPAPGGTCLHRGCIPTKALLQSAHVIDLARESSYFGIQIENPQVDLDGVLSFQKKVVDRNAKGVQLLLKKNKVEMVEGTGRLDGPTQVRVITPEETEVVVDADNIVLATGSVPARPGFLDFKDSRIITSDEALRLDEIPRHVTILGAGAVGCEFASIFRSFGSEVLLVELLDRLLPVEDGDCSAELFRSFKKRGIESRISTKLEKAEPGKDGIEVLLATEKGAAEKVQTDILLCAVGRKPVTDGLGLEKVGIHTENGFVAVNPDQSTVRPNVFAIGDIVASSPQLAHVASAEGIIAVEAVAGMTPQPIRNDRVPNATYCHPEVASVGLTEEAAKEEGLDVKVSKFPLSALGKSGIIGKAVPGFFKIIADEKYGEILGVHIIGPHATDLISEGCAILGLEGTAADLAHIIHPHPSLGEGMMEAAHGLVGSPIHM